MEATPYERQDPQTQSDGPLLSASLAAECIQARPIVTEPILLCKQPHLSKLGRGDLVFPLEALTPAQLSGSESFKVVSLGGSDPIEANIRLNADGFRLTDLVSAKSTTLELSVQQDGARINFLHDGVPTSFESAAELLLQDHSLQKLPLEVRGSTECSLLSEIRKDETYQGIIIPVSAKPGLKEFFSALLKRSGTAPNDSHELNEVKRVEHFASPEVEREMATEAGTSRCLKHASVSAKLSPIRDGWWRVNLAETLNGLGLSAHQINTLASGTANESGYNHSKVKISIAGNPATLSCGIVPEWDGTNPKLEYYRVQDSKVIVHSTGEVSPKLKLHFTITPPGEKRYVSSFEGTAALLAVRDTIAKTIQQNSR